MMIVSYFTNLQEHVDLIERSAQTVETVMGCSENIRFVVSSAKKLILPDNMQLLRFDAAERMPLMTANLWMQQQQLWMFGNYDILFLDPDVLMLKPFPKIKTEIVVTKRKPSNKLFQTQPYNFGVIAAEACQNTYDAWGWMVNRCHRLAARYQKWYGNQIALRELCGPLVKTDDGYEADYGFFNVSISQLDGEVYNYTPESAEEDLKDKVIVHCKGDRKDMFIEIHENFKKGVYDDPHILGV